MNKPHRAGVPVIAGLSKIAPRYDVILSDIWGVVHNGLESFAAATDALSRFRRRGGAVILITNAPRPNAPIREQLDELKVPHEAYDGIVTSGDVTMELIAARGSAPVHHIGPPRDLSLFETAAKLSRVAPPPPLVPLERADYVLCTGLFDDRVEAPGDYDAVLGAMLARRLTFICANPDLVVQRGDQLIYCAGALAQRYEEMGGEAIYAGKPYPPIYTQALSAASVLRGQSVDARILAIGDAMRTDVAGAVRRGIDVLFVTGGIHREDLHGSGPLEAAALEQFSSRHGFWPTAAIRDLTW